MVSSKKIVAEGCSLMKSRRIGLIVLIALIVLSSLGATGWLWTERYQLISTNATTQAEFTTLKDQITKADEVQDKNRQLQDQVTDLQDQLDEVQQATPVPNIPETPPATPAPATPADPSAPTATPGGPGGAAPPDEMVQLMQRIEQEVIALRGLPEERPVERRFLTRDELRAYIVAEMEKESTPADYRHSAQELWLLGLGPQDLDLQTLFVDMQTEQIAGFYDPEVDTFYLIGDSATLSPIDQITYAHEFDHNLQDQTVDLNAGLEQNEFDADRGLAYRALVEGDATLLMNDWTQQYLVQALSQDELMAMLQELQAQQEQSTVLDTAPTIVREGLLFPYQEGLAFVQSLYEQGGWPAVTAALSNPPTSTEQILHPEKYLPAQRDDPNLPDRFDLSAALGADWTTATTSTLGEFDLRVLLRDTAAQGDTNAAAAGIGGIRYALYESTAETPLVQMVARWDSPGDGDEFLSAFRSTLQGSGDVLKRNNVFVAIKGSGAEFTVLFSPDEAALRSALVALP
jgi:hypothetical protein